MWPCTIISSLLRYTYLLVHFFFSFYGCLTSFWAFITGQRKLMIFFTEKRGSYQQHNKRKFYAISYVYTNINLNAVFFDDLTSENFQIHVHVHVFLIFFTSTYTYISNISTVTLVAACSAS